MYHISVPKLTICSGSTAMTTRFVNNCETLQIAGLTFASTGTTSECSNCPSTATIYTCSSMRWTMKANKHFTLISLHNIILIWIPAHSQNGARGLSLTATRCVQGKGYLTDQVKNKCYTTDRVKKLALLLAICRNRCCLNMHT